MAPGRGPGQSTKVLGSEQHKYLLRPPRSVTVLGHGGSEVQKPVGEMSLTTGTARGTRRVCGEWTSMAGRGLQVLGARGKGLPPPGSPRHPRSGEGPGLRKLAGRRP